MTWYACPDDKDPEKIENWEKIDKIHEPRYIPVRICGECNKKINFKEFAEYYKLTMDDASYKFKMAWFLVCPECGKKIKNGEIKNGEKIMWMT